MRFLNESHAVRAEAALLREQGCDIIIVLSHCGLDVDYIIARNAGPDIDVIVGGQSHTYMYTGDNPGPDQPQDEYPAVVTNADGHMVILIPFFMADLAHIQVDFEGVNCASVGLRKIRWRSDRLLR